MSKRRFFVCFSLLFRIFFLAVAVDAVYILYYIHTVRRLGGEALLRGMTLSTVGMMAEHVLMSVVLLLLCALVAEIVRRRKF